MRRLASPGGSPLLDLWSDIWGPERCLASAPPAGWDSRVWFTVHLPPAYGLLAIPNVFGFPSSLHSSACSSPSPSIPSSTPPGFIPPPLQYEPNLNNVVAPHLIGCLIGQSARALMKNKQRNNNGGRCCRPTMGGKTTRASVHTHTHTYVLVLCIQSNYGIHPTCIGMPGQHFHQQRFNYNAHISNCFHDIGSVAMTPHVGHAWMPVITAIQRQEALVMH